MINDPVLIRWNDADWRDLGITVVLIAIGKPDPVFFVWSSQCQNYRIDWEDQKGYPKRYHTYPSRLWPTTGNKEALM